LDEQTFGPKEEEESEVTVLVDRVLNKFTMCKSLGYMHKYKQLKIPRNILNLEKHNLNIAQ